jgi:hypothetical protein
MSVIGRPARRFTGELAPIVPVAGSERDGFMFEVELYHPKSSMGRKVFVWLNRQDADDLLKVIRADAIEARRKAMPK